jgi:dTDP-glucose pyrophosphorylase
MIEKKYIIHQNQSLLEALTQINALQQGPLVLFVLDDEERMVGTLTDGDARRALIAGANVQEKAGVVMHTSFNFIREGEGNIVAQLHRQRELHMKLVPILDQNNRISDIINLEEFITKLPIDAVLMAGGKGERLRPLTEKIPKPLLPVGGKAIIDHNIDRLISYGVQHISVTVNYLKEQIEDHFAKPHNGVQVQTVREPKFLGTIGSIKFVKEFYNDTVLVMNSDVFTNINLEDFYLHFIEHNAVMSVAAIPYTVSVPYGIFDLNGRDINGLIEKPTYNYYANAGIYLIKREALDEIPEDTFFHSTDLIEKLISENKKVIRFPLNGTWIDIGNPQEYQKANELVKHMRW